ncbi:F-type H+-transporting ATPase subunit gamma [Parelusimicrobium proximum]|uniref:ATP synthase F1 subunit gamma n=1 Tax=Parelusimicrobium proximum TaxID=3228953 RepID=UPI003D1669F5
MESLKDIRENIKSINSIRQVMLTMKMISSARIKKAQRSMEAARPFALRMAEVIDDLEQDIMSPDSHLDSTLIRPFFDNSHADEDSAGLLLITADRGLAGAFNALLIREALKWIREHKDKKMYIFCIGKKGRDFIARLKMPNINLVYEMVGIFPKAGYVHADMLGNEMMKDYLGYEMKTLDIIYNDFENAAKQTLKTEQFFPFSFDKVAGKKEQRKEKGLKTDDIDFIYEPSLEKMFMSLVPRYVKARLYRVLLESQASELAARMNAMDNASRNAGDIVADLGVKLNKVRQASITNEIAEIVRSAEALNN